MTAQLLIGPLLRRVTGDRATIWVETSEPAQVRVEADGGAAGSAPTFSAYGHHYALVVVDGLAPDAANAYRVLLDDRGLAAGRLAVPAVVIRTRAADDAAQPVSLLFGSCREAHPARDRPHAAAGRAGRVRPAPDGRPGTAPPRPAGPARRPGLRGRDLARRCAGSCAGAARPASDAPADQVVAFEEYTKLYLESWRDPEVRWLLSTVPSVMIFDDHELIDDWNTSASWRADMAAHPWWRERIAGGLTSYWVYQHLGNLSPDELAADPLFQKVVGRRRRHRAAARVRPRRSTSRTRADNTDGRTSGVSPSTSAGPAWSCWTTGATGCSPRRAGRCCRAAEWDWFIDQAHGDYDHLVIGSSLPWLMPPAIHHLEAWNERLADPAARAGRRFGEKLRRAFDLEHWAAFGQLVRRRSASCSGGSARAAPARPATGSAPAGRTPHRPRSASSPATCTTRTWPGPTSGTPMATPVYQLTCSPIHNEVPLPHAPADAGELVPRGGPRCAGWPSRPAVTDRR